MSPLLPGHFLPGVVQYTLELIMLAKALLYVILTAVHGTLRCTS